MLPLCDVKLNTGFKIPQSNVVKNVRKATCDSVNFTGKNSSFDFSDFDIKKSVKIYPGEIRKMEQGQWVLLPDCGATFELADCERLDTKTKDFEKRLNSLKNNGIKIIIATKINAKIIKRITFCGLAHISLFAVANKNAANNAMI